MKTVDYVFPKISNIEIIITKWIQRDGIIKKYALAV